MRFSDTTQQAILKLWFEGMSMERIAACYTTTTDAIEHMIRVQLRANATNKVTK